MWEFWNPMYLMLLKVYCSSFLVFAGSTMIDLLRNKDELLEWTVPALKWSVKKGNMESTV